MNLLGLVGDLSILPMSYTAFTNHTGVSPQASEIRAVTVPAHNSGVFKVTYTQTGGSFQYRINSGTYNTVPASGGTLTALNNGDTLQFQQTGASTDTSGIQTIDNSTGQNVNGTFNLVCT